MNQIVTTKHTWPFDHWVVDNFFEHDLAVQLSDDFVDFDHPDWYVYDNPLEVKKTLNNWWHFPPTTYRCLKMLNSQPFISHLEQLTGIVGLQPDPGLHGAGWHIHGRGGKLNVHLDYSIHPKLALERKLNLIIYLSDNWDRSWGGNLELWYGNKDTATDRAKTIECRFNRAVIFDTTQNSWHGFPQEINCPNGVYRKSIAVYYLIHPQQTADVNRRRAKYVASEQQINDPAIQKLIEQRMQTT